MDNVGDKEPWSTVAKNLVMISKLFWVCSIENNSLFHDTLNDLAHTVQHEKIIKNFFLSTNVKLKTQMFAILNPTFER